MTVTQARLRSILRYDEGTGIFVWVCPPDNHSRLLGQAAGCTSTGYVLIRIDGRKYKAHRLAWLYVHGELPKSRIDHRDGDPLNNELGNLRLATQAQNCANAARKRGKDLPKGVRHTRSGQFQARIRHCGQLTHLGTFPTVEAAAAAYLAAAEQRFGEFARAA